MTTEPILHVTFQNITFRDRTMIVLELQNHLLETIDCTDIEYTNPKNLDTVQFIAVYKTGEEIEAELAEYNARWFKEWWA